MTQNAFVDFDHHGLAGERLVDAASSDAAAVGRQLGPLPRTLDREPDITIRFVDRIEHRSRLRYLGANLTIDPRPIRRPSLPSRRDIR